MRNKLTLLFLLLSVPLFSQSWQQLISSNTCNYYDVLRSFDLWNDSVTTAQNKLNYNSPEIRKSHELRKQFKQWAISFSARMNSQGAYMSDAMLWKEKEQYYNFKLNAPSSQSSGTWSPTGPQYVFPIGNNSGNGMVQTLAVNPNDTAIMYAGTPAGGLWKTINGGINWVPLTDSIAKFGVKSIVIDPVNSDILYMVVASILYKSYDAGATWTNLNIDPLLMPAYKTKILINPDNNQVLYLLGYYCILKSTDGGISWNIIFNGNCADITFNPLNPGTIYSITPGKFFKSFNGGMSFDSTAQALSWWGAKELGVTQVDTNYIYIYSGVGNGVDGVVALSVDGGMTFNLQPVSNQLPTFNDLKHIMVSPTDKNTIIFGGITMSKSVNAGITWTSITGGANQTVLPFVHVDHRQLILTGNTLWSANDGGVYKTDDFGITFQDLTGDMQITEINDISSSLNDTVAILGGAMHLGVMQQTDTGWTCVGAGDGFNVVINPDNSDEFFYKHQYGYVHIIDGGMTQLPMGNGITESTYSFNTNYPLIFNNQNKSSTYLLIKNVWKSENNGTDYTKLSNFPSGTQGGAFLYVHPADSNYIYTAYHKSIDGGLTWNPLTLLQAGIGKLAVDPLLPTRIWATNNSYVFPLVGASTDGGITWTLLPTNDLPDQNVIGLEYVANGFDGLVLVLKNSVFYIDNRLNNWQPFDNGLPYVNFSDINVLPAINKLRLSTIGRGLWERGLYDTNQPLVVDFIADKDSICIGATIQFNDNSLNNGPGFSPSYTWQFPGGTPSFSTLENPVVTYNNPGSYQVSLTISSTVGNDSVTKSNFIYVAPPVTTTAPLTEGFEGIFPPYGWNIIDDYPIERWRRSAPGSYGNSSYSAMVTNYSTAVPELEVLLSPEINFFTVLNPILFFDRAYATDTIPNSDTLKIFYTTDCNLTRTYIYAKGGADLATMPPQIYGYIPDSTEWETDTVNLAGIPVTAQIGFQSTNYNGNLLYLDNINITGTTGLEQNNLITDLNITVYPNPADEKVTISWKGKINFPAEITIHNMLGQTLHVSEITHSDHIDIAISAILPGLYSIQLKIAAGSFVRKFIVE